MDNNFIYTIIHSNFRRSNLRSRRNNIYDKFTYISYDLSWRPIHVIENNNKSKDVVMEEENSLEENKFENN